MELGLHLSQPKRSPKGYDYHVLFNSILLLTGRNIKANVITDVLVDRVTSEVYHIEGRPSEAGRNVLVHTTSGQDVVGAGWNVRTAVQEYGGGEAIVHNNIAYFSNLSDGGVYQVKARGQPELVSPGKRLTTLGDSPYQSSLYSSWKTIPLCKFRTAS